MVLGIGRMAAGRVGVESSGSDDGSLGTGSSIATSVGQYSEQAPMTAAARRQAKLWKDTPYQRWAAANCSLLKYQLRAGCAPHMRCDVWLHASGGAALAAAEGAPSYATLARGGYAALARNRPRDHAVGRGHGTVHSHSHAHVHSHSPAPGKGHGLHTHVHRHRHSHSPGDGHGHGHGHSTGHAHAHEHAHAHANGNAKGHANGHGRDHVRFTDQDGGAAAAAGAGADADACAEIHAHSDACKKPIGRDSIRSAITGDAWIAIREESSFPFIRDALPKEIMYRLAVLPGAPSALQRILVAHAARSGAPGCVWRGAGVVAATLLAVQGNEEAAFWTLEGLSERLFAHCDGQAEFGCLVEAHVLASLVRSKLPRIQVHLVDKLEIDPAEMVLPWVARCFIGAAGGLEATCRLLDCLLLEGPKVLHRAGLALLAACEGTITSCAHPAALPQLIEGRSCRALDAPGREGELVGAAFRRTVVGGMGGDMLGALRATAVAEVGGRLEERRRRLAAIMTVPRRVPA